MRLAALTAGLALALPAAELPEAGEDPALPDPVTEPGGRGPPSELRAGSPQGVTPPAPLHLQPVERLSGGWLLPRRSALLRGEVVHPVDAAVEYGEGGARFGADRGGRAHEGQDVFAPAGTPIVATRDGVVLETGNDGGRGNYVGIYSPTAGETYVYLHLLAPPPVAAGDDVRAGQRVGRLGCTGSCFGDHLHFEVRRGKGLEGAPRDPLPLLRRWPRA